jgi:hypothetical protein
MLFVHLAPTGIPFIGNHSALVARWQHGFAITPSCFMPDIIAHSLMLSTNHPGTDRCFQCSSDPE